MKIYELIAEFYGCNEKTNDPLLLIGAAKAAAEKIGATVLGETTVRYQPHGTTSVLFLAESHICLTTWPENNLLLVDALLCNADMPTEPILEALRDVVCPDGDVRVQNIERVLSTAPPPDARPTRTLGEQA